MASTLMAAELRAFAAIPQAQLEELQKQNERLNQIAGGIDKIGDVVPAVR